MNGLEKMWDFSEGIISYRPKPVTSESTLCAVWITQQVQNEGDERAHLAVMDPVKIRTVQQMIRQFTNTNLG